MDGYVSSFGTGGDAGNVGGGVDVSDNVGPIAAFTARAADSGSGTAGGADRDGTVFDPDVHIGLDKINADGTYRRKRARKSGGSNSAGNRNKARANTETGVAAIARIFYIVHAGLASATKTPEIALADEDSKALAEATARVLDEFDIRPDPKIEAIIGLITTASVVYGPRAYMINMRRKVEADAKKNG